MSSPSTPPAAPARRRRRWLVILLVLVIGAVIGVKVLLAPERLTPLVEGILNDTLRGTVHIDRVEYRAPLGVRVERFVMTATTGDHAVVQVDVLEAVADIGPLLSGHLVIPEATVRGAKVRLARATTTGTFDLVEAFLPRAASDPSQPSTFRMNIGALRIEDADVEMIDPRSVVQVRGATVTRGSLSVDPDSVVVGVDVEAGQARLKIPPFDERSAIDLGATGDGIRFTWSFAEESGHLVIDETVFAMTGAAPIRGRASGQIGHLASALPMTTDAQIHLDVPLANPLAALSPDTIAATGTASIDAHATGLLLTPTLTATINAIGVVVLDEPLGPIRAVGRADPAAITLDGFFLPIDDGAIGGKARVDLLKDAWVVDANLIRAPVRRIAGRFIADTSLLPLRLDGPIQVSGTFDARDPVRIAASVQGSGIALDARGSVGRSVLDLAIDLRDRALAPLFQRYLRGGSAREAQLVGRLRGTPQKPEASGVLTMKHAFYKTPVPVDLAVPFALSGARLTLDGATLTSSIGAVKSSGTVLLPLFDRAGLGVELALDVETNRVDLAALTAGMVHGRARLAGRISGDPTKPSGKIDVALERIEVAGVVARPTELHLTAENGRYTLDNAKIELAQGGSLEVRGTTDLTTIEGRLIGKAVPLGLLTATSTTVAQVVATSTTPGGIALAGNVDILLTLSGPLATPEINGRVNGQHLLIGGAEFSRLKMRAEGPFHALEIDGLAVGLGGTVRIEGKVDATARTGSVEILVRGLDIPQIPGVPIDGRLDAELRFEGGLPYPDVRGRVAFRELRYLGPNGAIPIGEELVTLDIAPGLHGALGPSGYDLVLAVGRGLHADIALTLEPAIGAVAKVAVTDLSIGPFLPQLSDRTIDAIVSATATVTYSERRGVEARGSLNNLVVGTDGREVELIRPAAIEYARGKIEIGKLRVEGVKGWLEIEGSAGDRLDLHASASINAAILPALARGIQQASGRFAIVAEIGGTPDAPEIDAKLDLEEKVALRPRAGAVREIVLDEASIRATPDRVVIDALSGRMAGGSFRARGEVGLDGFELSRFDLGFDATSVPIRTGELAVEANVGLRLTGDIGSPLLAGDVEIVRARYQKQFKLQNFVFVSERTDPGPGLAEQLPWLADLELDIHATSPGDIQVAIDANAVQVLIDLAADVSIKGSPISPRLDGRVTSDSGTLKFPKATLEVRSVAVDFDPFPGDGRSGIYVRLVADGEVLPSDGVDRTAQARLVTLVLSGPIEEMQLDLQSAGLDRLAVLSLLITGRAQLDQEGALAFAGSQLSAPITAFIEQQLEKALNLGLHFGTELSTTAVKFSASKEITRRLVIEGSYQRAFDQAGTVTTTVRALLYLFDRAFLEVASSQSKPSVVTPGQPVAGDARATRVELKYQILGR